MSNKKILVVDDEKSIRDVLNQAFSKAGYTVLLKAAEVVFDKIERWQVEDYLKTFNALPTCFLFAIAPYLIERNITLTDST